MPELLTCVNIQHKLHWFAIQPSEHPLLSLDLSFQASQLPWAKNGPATARKCGIPSITEIYNKGCTMTLEGRKCYNQSML